MMNFTFFAVTVLNKVVGLGKIYLEIAHEAADDKWQVLQDRARVHATPANSVGSIDE